MYSISENLKWLPTDSCLKNASVTFPRVVVGKITQQRSALLKEAPAVSYLCAPCEPWVCVCQEGAEIDRAVQSSAGP